MGTTKISDVQHGLKLSPLQVTLIKECRVMANYAMANGKSLDAKQLAPLAKKDSELSSAELLPVYNYLLLLVKPAKPGTLILFEKNRQSKSRFKFLGPLPIIRRFMLVAILSLLALIAFSLSPDVNATSIELSMLQGYGLDQALRLGFLLAAASVGASFYALFRMNHFINEGTFDLKYSATYWSRYVLGLVAGILLSELFVVFIDTSTQVVVDQHISENAGLSEKGILNTTRYLIKPILAIVGGFSANLVYRILNRIIEAIESLFKGSTEEQLSQRQAEVMAQNQEAMNQDRASTAHQLLNIKNDLVSSGISPDMLGKLDEMTGGLVPTLSSAPPMITAEAHDPEPDPDPATAPGPEVEAPKAVAEPPIEGEEGKEDKEDGTPPASW